MEAFIWFGTSSQTFIFRKSDAILKKEKRDDLWGSLATNQHIQVLPSSSLITVRLAEHAASPALFTALQVYCPACSEKASTMMSVAMFVTSSKWNTTFLEGWTSCRLWSQLISGFGRPDTHAWKRATSPCVTVQLVIAWMKIGFWPTDGFFRLETCHWGSVELLTVWICPEMKQVQGSFFI